MPTTDSTHSRPNLLQYLYPWSISTATAATVFSGIVWKISSFHLNRWWSNDASSTPTGWVLTGLLGDAPVKQITNDYLAPVIGGAAWFLTTVTLNIVAENLFQAKAPPEPIAQMPTHYIPKNVMDAIQAPATPKSLVSSSASNDYTEPEDSDNKALVLRSTFTRRKASFSFDNHRGFVPPPTRKFNKEVSKTLSDEVKPSDILGDDDEPCEGARKWCRRKKKGGSEVSEVSEVFEVDEVDEA